MPKRRRKFQFPTWHKSYQECSWTTDHPALHSASLPVNQLTALPVGRQAGHLADLRLRKCRQPVSAGYSRIWTELAARFFYNCGVAQRFMEAHCVWIIRLEIRTVKNRDQVRNELLIITQKKMRNLCAVPC